MKYLRLIFCVIIILTISVSSIAYAEWGKTQIFVGGVEFHDLTIDQLSALRNFIDKRIASLSDPSNQSNIIYDLGGLLIEFMGITRTDSGYLVFDIKISNYSGEDIFFSTENDSINDCVIKLTNGARIIPNNSTYLSRANNDFVIEDKDLLAYNIKQIHTVSFDIDVGDSNYNDLPGSGKRVTINVDFPT